MKAGKCARDRRALQQLALNVHVKHSDLTLPDMKKNRSLDLPPLITGLALLFAKFASCKIFNILTQKKLRFGKRDREIFSVHS